MPSALISIYIFTIAPIAIESSLNMRRRKKKNPIVCGLWMEADWNGVSGNGGNWSRNGWREKKRNRLTSAPHPNERRYRRIWAAGRGGKNTVWGKRTVKFDFRRSWCDSKFTAWLSQTTETNDTNDLKCEHWTRSLPSTIFSRLQSWWITILFDAVNEWTERTDQN